MGDGIVAAGWAVAVSAAAGHHNLLLRDLFEREGGALGDGTVVAG